MSLIRLKEVLEIVSCSKSTWHRWEAAGIAPKRRRLGTRAIGYLLSEIDEFLASRPTVEIHCADAPTRAAKPAAQQ